VFVRHRRVRSRWLLVERLVDFAQRAARNEEVFRGVNEQIEEGGERHGVASPLRFYCECDRVACFEMVELQADEYRRVLERRYCFVVVPGHDDPRVERLVEEHDTHCVVEKIGEARAALDQEHPQQGHRT
jgi:hypothetical protein